MKIHKYSCYTAQHFPLALLNAGKPCYENCGRKQGSCSWCGTLGACCIRNRDRNNTSNGCDGTFVGGQKSHKCVLDQRKGSLLMKLTLKINF